MKPIEVVTTYDLLLDGRPLAQNLLPTTVEDLCKLNINEINWAIEEAGRCNMIDDSGRELELIVYSDAERQS
jgi:hypothetical protein